MPYALAAEVIDLHRSIAAGHADDAIGSADAQRVSGCVIYAAIFCLNDIDEILPDIRFGIYILAADRHIELTFFLIYLVEDLVSAYRWYRI